MARYSVLFVGGGRLSSQPNTSMECSPTRTPLRTFSIRTPHDNPALVWSPPTSIYPRSERRSVGEWRTWDDQPGRCPSETPAGCNVIMQHHRSVDQSRASVQCLKDTPGGETFVCQRNPTEASVSVVVRELKPDGFRPTSSNL